MNVQLVYPYISMLIHFIFSNLRSEITFSADLWYKITSTIITTTDNNNPLID